MALMLVAEMAGHWAAMMVERRVVLMVAVMVALSVEKRVVLLAASLVS